MGERHIFLRFERCNIHCEYCDEIDKPGFEMELETVLSKIKTFEQEDGPHAFVSLTGGEPLVYSSFLKELCPALVREGFLLYLETNGILWKALKEILPWVRVIAMDLKPASVTKDKTFMDEHRRFLEIAKTKETFIKIVISKEIDIAEFRDLCELVRSVHPLAPVILQPISTKEREGYEDPELMRLLEELRRIASGSLRDVRIVPRLHKILGIR